MNQIHKLKYHMVSLTWAKQNTNKRQVEGNKMIDLLQMGGGPEE